MSNTTPKNAAPNDPFWDKAEGMFLQALIFYVWLEMNTVVAVIFGICNDTV